MNIFLENNLTPSWLMNYFLENNLTPSQVMNIFPENNSIPWTIDLRYSSWSLDPRLRDSF